jgi:glutamate-1-semialdehyde 2,1-aminomutase
MEAAQTTFISSTFWTERIGPTAALATLEVMKEESATQRVHEIGTDVQNRWLKAAECTGLHIGTGGLPALANFTVHGLDPLAVKTFITAQMLEQEYLAGPNLYASIAHTDAILDDYIAALTPVFEKLASMSDPELKAELPRGTAQSGFKRLT